MREKHGRKGVSNVQKRLLVALWLLVSRSVLSAEIITYYDEEDSQGYWVLDPYEYVAVRFDVGENPRLLYQVRFICYAPEHLRVWITPTKEDTTSAIATIGNIDPGSNGYGWDTVDLPEPVSVVGEIWVLGRFRNFRPEVPFFPGIDIHGHDSFPYTSWAKVWPYVGMEGFWGPAGTNLGIAIVVDEPLGIDAEGPSPLPKIFTLEQNYPNPFNPHTFISFSLGEFTFVSLEVYDLRGATVKSLLRKECRAGKYEVSWDGTDHVGQKVPSGVYFYRLTANEGALTKKMILVE